MNDQLSFPAKVKTLNIIHAALPGILMLMAVVVSVVGSDMGDPKSPMVLQVIPGALLIIALLLSSILLKQQLKEGIRKESSLSTKLAVYQGAHLVRIAPIEAAGLFGAVIPLVTIHNYNLIVTALAIGLLIIYRPSVDRICRELNLSMDERRELEGN